MRKTITIALVLGGVVATSGVAAQDAPSWRSFQETPKKTEIPPEMDRPEMTFSVDRSALFDSGLGYSSKKTSEEPSEGQLEVLDPADIVEVDEFQNQGDAEMSQIVVDVVPESDSEQSINEDSLGLLPLTTTGAEDELITVETGSGLSGDPEMSSQAGDIDAFVLTVNPSEAEPLADPQPAEIQPPANEDQTSLPMEAAESDVALDDVQLAETLPEEVDASAGETEMTQPEVDEVPVLAALTPELKAPASETTEFKTVRREKEIFKLVRQSGKDPEYPQDAARRGVEGWVELEFLVAVDGSVDKVKVVDSWPHRTFDRTAIKATRNWVFVAPATSGYAETQSGRLRLDFKLAGN